jgi:hypothetical protein
MPSKPVAPTIIACLAALSFCLALPAAAPAQAWIPPKGDGSVSVTYSNMYVRNHVDNTGRRSSAAGRIRTNSVVTSFEYGITDKLALNASLAHITAKYIGKSPHGPDDDGSYHPTFQDAHIELLYNALNRKSWVVTPFIGATIPTHDYETRGHSAVGRGFHELRLGANVGRQFERFLPASYVHARYSYAILNRFDDINLNRSDADFEVGWFANGRLSFRFIADLQKTHGGLATPLDQPHLDEHEIEFHDRITRSNYVNLGGGIGFSVNRSFGMHAAYLANVYARNTHAHGGLVVGISWNFSRGLGLDSASTNISPGRLASSVQATY